MSQVYTLYKHTCPNNKSYVGITSREPEKRWLEGYGYKENKHFFRAITKYGWDNIKHEILETSANKEYICKREQEEIKRLKLQDSRYGYNHSDGGEINRGFHRHFSKETRKKISESRKGQGHPHTEETKRKLSEMKKGQKPLHTFQGHHHKQSTKEIFRKQQTKWIIYVYDKNKKLILKTLGFIEVTKKLHLPETSVRRYCNTNKLYKEKYYIRKEKYNGQNRSKSIKS